MARAEWHCYTDGSCKAGEGAPGGWGYHARPPASSGGAPLEDHGKALGTLAKVMEYRAVAEALAALPAEASAVVFADNQSLVVNLATKLGDWQRSTFANVDPLVAPEVKRIALAIVEKRLDVRFEWVRGHGSNVGNERADALAAQGAREAKADLAKKTRGVPHR